MYSYKKVGEQTLSGAAKRHTLLKDNVPCHNITIVIGTFENPVSVRRIGDVLWISRDDDDITQLAETLAVEAQKITNKVTSFVKIRPNGTKYYSAYLIDNKFDFEVGRAFRGIFRGFIPNGLRVNAGKCADVSLYIRDFLQTHDGVNMTRETEMRLQLNRIEHSLEELRREVRAKSAEANAVDYEKKRLP